MSVDRYVIEEPKEDRFCPRTDLACERDRPAAETEEIRIPVCGEDVCISRRRETDGGRYITVACGRITARDEAAIDPLAELLAREISDMARSMMGKDISLDTRVFVVGLGNADMTPDAIGPGTVRRMTVTRHLRAYDESLFASLGCCELSALAPGVMGQTGLESGELCRAASELLHPDLVVAVDALAARSCERLASTVQLSDRGIAPGSGIGNHRMAIDASSMGCPVMGLGVPTVVDSATLVLDALAQAGMDTQSLPDGLISVLESGRSFIVSPRDSDRMVELTCRLLARALDMSFGVEEFCAERSSN